MKVDLLDLVERRWFRIIAYVLMIAFLALLLRPSLGEPRSHPRWLRSMHQVGNVVKGMHNSLVLIEGEESFEPSWILYWLKREELSRSFKLSDLFPQREISEADSASMIRIGPYSASDYLSGLVSAEELRTVARERIGDAPWETLGDVVISRDVIPMLLSDDGDVRESVAADSLVACFSVRPYTEGGLFVDKTYALIGLWDGSVRRIHISSNGRFTEQYKEFLAADHRARAALGLSEPPDYASLIHEYSEAQP